jgi:hypothetical protein
MTVRYVAAGPPIIGNGTHRYAWECPVPAAVVDAGGPDGWHVAFDGTDKRPRARWWRRDYAAGHTGPARKVMQTRTVGPWITAGQLPLEPKESTP